MNIPFLGGRRGKRDSEPFADPEGAAALLSECELLRAQAARAGVELDDSVASLAELDQLLPRWRDDEELLPSLGNDAGFYLGTVIVRTVGGAAWAMRGGEQPVVRLASGREVDVTEAGRGWAARGVPELCQTYAEVAEAGRPPDGTHTPPGG
ncbi:DUF6278 family protein [Streptomyces sp. MS06]|uniref:DUF6278 family protein n=1 Tax=Streptomyces sp. MS06 TaxID=3385974 RepID=UPI00399F5945